MQEGSTLMSCSAWYGTVVLVHNRNSYVSYNGGGSGKSTCGEEISWCSIKEDRTYNDVTTTTITTRHTHNSHYAMSLRYFSARRRRTNRKSARDYERKRCYERCTMGHGRAHGCSYASDAFAEPTPDIDPFCACSSFL